MKSEDRERLVEGLVEDVMSAWQDCVDISSAPEEICAADILTILSNRPNYFGFNKWLSQTRWVIRNQDGLDRMIDLIAVAMEGRNVRHSETRSL
jgi:hypothetical protein